MKDEKLEGNVRRVEFYCSECQEHKSAFDNYSNFEDNVTKWVSEFSKKTRKSILCTCSDCGRILGTILIENKYSRKKKIKK